MLETERTYLREFKLEDAADMYKLNSDPEVIRFTGNQAFNSVDEARVFIVNYNHYKICGYGRWAVINKETRAFMGWCGLKNHEEKFIDLGYRFLREYWNKGYATETARSSLEYGFNTLGMTEIIGRAASENTASIRVLEKLNMTFWKRDVCEGIEDTVYYRLSADAFN